MQYAVKLSVVMVIVTTPLSNRRVITEGKFSGILSQIFSIPIKLEMSRKDGTL
jgi:hypothetical protein